MEKNKCLSLEEIEKLLGGVASGCHISYGDWV